jgi:mRNA-degrading endonuclease RelE of RelBE toxin-antitoxin system
MTNQVELTGGAIQDLKQLDANVRQFLYTQFVELATRAKDTYLYEKFQYEYCRFDNTLYRVIYKVDVEGKLIIIALVSSGENLYQELAQCIY